MFNKEINCFPACSHPTDGWLDSQVYVENQAQKLTRDIVDVIALVHMPISFFWTILREERSLHIFKIVRVKTPQVNVITLKAKKFYQGMKKVWSSQSLPG